MLPISAPAISSILRRHAGVAVLAVLAPVLAAPAPARAQQQPPANLPRITQAIDDSVLTTLKGNVHPLARPQYDIGAASPSLPMRRMLMVLKRGDAQEYALKTLIDAQQDKRSGGYHQWLTPGQLGESYGPADADIQKITGWLQSQGFQIGSVSKARTIIEFTGNASQVQNAFHTAIHTYAVNGEQHYANNVDPKIPAALAPVVAGIASLNNFPKKSLAHFAGTFQREKATGRVTQVSGAKPLFTYTDTNGTFYGITPYDLATIYNIQPLWTAGTDGTGQIVAIAGRSNINPQDDYDFRTLFGLPTGGSLAAFQQQYLNIILNGVDPGNLGGGEEAEADIDTQWSGAAAKGAMIDFVVSQSTEVSDGADLSALYIIDNNLAPVMSYSFGTCELGLGTSGNQFYNALWEQAAAQGISAFVAAGDEGSAACDGAATMGAQFGLAVSGQASTPFSTGVGGTDFDQLNNNPTNYWNSSNNTNQASAKGYIPETTWNNSCTNAAYASVSQSLSSDPLTLCNDSSVLNSGGLVVAGGSGGPSNCNVANPNGSCGGGYGKPSWQTQTQTYKDNVRDVPDLSLFASNGFAGSFYIVCQASANTDASQCNLNSPYADFQGYGGTSVASPAIAGVFGILNQKLGSRVGNANYVLYNLAASQSGTSCNSSNGPSSSCIFNDITSGTISQPCSLLQSGADSPNCLIGTGDTYGVLVDDDGSGYNTIDPVSGYPSDLGWNVRTGYDYATGLGSINVANLVNQWSTASFTASTTTLALSNATFVHGTSTTATVKVNSSSGTPSGDVSINGAAPNGSVGFFTLASGTAQGPINNLPGGSYNVIAHYGGNNDGTHIFAGSDSNPVAVTVSPEASTTIISAILFNTQTGGGTAVTTASYGSPLFARADVKGVSGNGVATGTVAITDNGSALSGSPYKLNSTGDAENQRYGPSAGVHTLAGSYSGDPSFNASTGTTSLTVTQATPAVTASASSTTIAPGASVTLTAVVDTTSYASGPTGTVQFLMGTTPLGSAVAVAAGTDKSGFPEATATLTTTALTTAGNVSITAMYSGDTNFATATSPAIVVTVSSMPVTPSFGFTPAPAAVSIAPGATSGNSTTVSITPSGGFTGAVALSATLTTQPAGAQDLPTMSLNPASITISGTAVGTSVATISSTASSSGALAYPSINNHKANRWYEAAGGAALACILFFGIPARRRAWRTLLGLFIVLVTMAGVGCGGGGGGNNGNPGTTAGTYVFTVTGVNGTTSKTTTITVTVQ